MEPSATPRHDEALAQTITSIEAAMVSQGRFADLAYPATLTRRIADRVLRESFESTFRLLPAMRPMRDAARESAHHRARNLTHPPRRGAKAIDIDRVPDALADAVGAILARDGLVHAACRAVHDHPPERDKAAERLSSAGVPIDLLAHVLGQPRDAHGESAAAALIVDACTATTSIEQARDHLARAHSPRAWAPTAAGATLRSDAGDAPHSAAIVSLARADYLFAPGDGGALDHVRACVRALDPSPIIALAMATHDARTLLDAPDALQVSCERAPAQFLRDAIAIMHRPQGPSTLLLPRFPSRSEVGTPFAPDLLPCSLDALNASLHDLTPAHTDPPAAIHSPLHFHGGDILCWHDRDGAHALIGEGTLARNTAMGLTESQAKDALTREFNLVERIVLPAVTFHVDTCVSVLATPAGPSFLVADPLAAARLIILEGCERLRKGGVLTPAIARAIANAVARDNPFAQTTTVSNTLAFELLATHALAPFAQSGAPPLATFLSPADPDGGAASALRFLHAVDLIAAASNTRATPPHVDAYLRSIRRTLDDLEALSEILRTRGKVHPLAAGVTGQSSAPAVNLVHLGSGETLMPCFGGVCDRLDAANHASLARLGRRPIPIPSSESAFRQGAVRCSTVLL